jgi:hypothetical protein
MVLKFASSEFDSETPLKKRPMFACFKGIISSDSFGVSAYINSIIESFLELSEYYPFLTSPTYSQISVNDAISWAAVTQKPPIFE